VAVYQLAITIGILCAYFSNAHLQKLSGRIVFHHEVFSWMINREVWRAMFGMYVLPSALFFFLLLLIPESPRWLAIRGDTGLAMQILGRFNSEEQVAAEMQQIEASGREGKGEIHLLFSRAYRIPLIIGLLLPLLSQFSGINAVIYYGPRILEKAGFMLGEALGGQVTIGIINVLFTLLAIFTIDRWGRKPLLMLGIGGATLALIFCGLLFALDLTQGRWILIAILLYIACFAFSFGPVCWVIIGEIYPNTIRGRAMSLATFSLWIGCFFVGQLTPVMLNGIGASGTFWLFALLCLPAFWISWKLIPETRGRTLEEIEQSWKTIKKTREQ
jgi:MFS transporter, SP family, arabinose:H+ symporter